MNNEVKPFDAKIVLEAHGTTDGRRLMCDSDITAEVKANQAAYLTWLVKCVAELLNRADFDADCFCELLTDEMGRGKEDSTDSEAETEDEKESDEEDDEDDIAKALSKDPFEALLFTKALSIAAATALEKKNGDVEAARKFLYKSIDIGFKGMGEEKK